MREQPTGPLSTAGRWGAAAATTQAVLISPSEGRAGAWVVEGSSTTLRARDVAHLSAVARRGARLPGTHQLDTSPRGAALLVLLRELQEVGAVVDWQGELGDLTVDEVAHLPPPRPADSDAGAAPDDIQRWRARHQYGLFYYRCGPDFVYLVDRRSTESAQRYVIHDAGLLCAFRSSIGSHDDDACRKAPARNDVQLLVNERTLIEIRGGRYLCLAHRMRRWPVPFDAV